MKLCMWVFIEPFNLNVESFFLLLFSFFMPPTSKKFRGHIGLILSVCPLRFLADKIS